MRTAMSNETKETGSSFMEKLSTVIVDKRNLIFLLTIILLVFSAFSRNWVEVESDLTYYLPSDSETKQALDIMDEQFTTYGTAEVMASLSNFWFCSSSVSCWLPTFTPKFMVA
mgnify:CR=1 FL=1